MNAQKFLSEILARGGIFLKAETANTCDAWGFDGWFGIRHIFLLSGVRYELRDGKVSFRYQGTKKLFAVYSYEPKFVQMQAKDFLATLKPRDGESS
jgi:hypothetical protein